MLPFSKRKKSDEIELTEDDLVVLEDEAEAVEIDLADLEARHRLPPISSPPAKPASRSRLITPRNIYEDDVADECLKSIAAATSRARLSDSFPASIVPPPPRLPQFELDDADETTRRPAIASSGSMPIARDSVPGVLPVPVPSAPLSASSIPTPVFSRTSSPHPLSSIAPVSLSSAPAAPSAPAEPTVILLHRPPRTAWVVAAAMLGAACAIVGMHLVSRSTDPAPATIVVTAPPPPPATVAAPAASPHAPAGHAAASPPATVRFNDAQGVAVVATPAVVAAPPAAAQPAPAKPVVTTAALKPAPSPANANANANAKPATTGNTGNGNAAKTASLGPKLPDGTVALGARAPEPPPAKVAPAPAPQPEPAPAPAGKRKLTPEQELADAQLKASMR